MKLYDYGVRRHHFEKFPNYKQTIYDPESFQKTHQDTLFDLVIEHELNINNALNEIVNLDGNKVALLRLLYAHGLRRQHLDKFITPFSSDHFEALVYLIDTNNLNPETAVAEINGIEDHAALKCIAKLYSRNFTRRHIVALNSNGSNIYENGNIIFNLVNECGLSGDEIVSEIQGLCMNRQKALVNLYHQGLRGEHLRKCLIKNFTKDHLNKLIYLMRDKYFSPEKAVQRMNTLYTFSGFIQNFVPACVRAQPEDVSEPLLSSTRSLGNH
ncbi:MAG: hypothetical protein HWD59_03310 [Coxiellaceae bacterium]|nr:MAG: hypothetical protein HWD59_03310 [Coxiellaceae bacterium]